MAVKPRATETTPVPENASTSSPDTAPDASTPQENGGSTPAPAKRRGRKPGLFVTETTGYMWQDAQDMELAKALKMEKPPGTLRTGASVASYLNTLPYFIEHPVTAKDVSDRVTFIRDVYLPSKAKTAPEWLTLDVRHRASKPLPFEEAFT